MLALKAEPDPVSQRLDSDVLYLTLGLCVSSWNLEPCRFCSKTFAEALGRHSRTKQPIEGRQAPRFRSGKSYVISEATRRQLSSCIRPGQRSRQCTVVACSAPSNSVGLSNTEGRRLSRVLCKDSATLAFEPLLSLVDWIPESPGTVCAEHSSKAQDNKTLHL